MKTPEEIALIGGGILLSSGLVFGLKSGAASELPNVSRSVDTALQGKKNADSSSSSSSDSAGSANQAAAQQKQQQEQAQQQAAQKQQAFENSFDGRYQKAQQNHWQTGQWGTAKFYIDNQGNMHIGKGQLLGSIYKLVNRNQLNTISIDEPVVAPKNSDSLFSSHYDSNPLTAINGLSNLDTSQVTNMNYMFADLVNVNSLDVSHFDTHNVTDMSSMFSEDNVTNLDVSHFNTSHVTNMSYMFSYMNNLLNIDTSHFDTHNVTDMSEMFFDDADLSSLDLSNFNTSRVTDMSSLFYADNSLNVLNISSFDMLSSNTNTYQMFGNTGEVDNISQISLGDKTTFYNSPVYNTNNNTAYLSNTYKSGNQTMNGNDLTSGQAHPGTWYKQ